MKKLKLKSWIKYIILMIITIITLIICINSANNIISYRINVIILLVLLNLWLIATLKID